VSAERATGASSGPGVIRAASLPALISGRRAPLWWAMLLLVVIETAVFGSLFAGYLYLRAGAAEWPPAGMPLPDLLLPGINTIVLLLSSVAVYWAAQAIKRGDARRLKIGLALGLLLEIVFLTIKIIESADFGAGWDVHAYASIFWSISGLHTLHVIAAILMVAPALVLALKGYYTQNRRLGVQAVAIYWQFVAVMWIPVLAVLYLLPRWL
jgi:cytochrome c oxidase subunit III